MSAKPRTAPKVHVLPVRLARAARRQGPRTAAKRTGSSNLARFFCDINVLSLAVQAVSSEPVSGGWTPNSLLNREKTGNFNVFGQYGGIFGRITSSNQ